LSYEKFKRNDWTIPDEDMIDCFNKSTNDETIDE
jgi:hypothetical protein